MRTCVCVCEREGVRDGGGYLMRELRHCFRFLLRSGSKTPCVCVRMLGKGRVRDTNRRGVNTQTLHAFPFTFRLHYKYLYLQNTERWDTLTSECQGEWMKYVTN